jgi:hypothetical protein
MPEFHHPRYSLSIEVVAGHEEITNDSRDGGTGDDDGKEVPRGINSEKAEDDGERRKRAV